MIQALIPVLAPILSDVIKRVLPDPEAQAKAEAELSGALMANRQRLEEAAASIVTTEAASRHWLAANWRPLTMVTFVALIVARWMGWTAPDMTPEEYAAVYQIILVGLGGYVGGRTLEKIAPGIIEAVKRR